MGWESDALGWDGEVYNLIFNFLKRWKLNSGSRTRIIRYTCTKVYFTPMLAIDRTFVCQKDLLQLRDMTTQDVASRRIIQFQFPIPAF